MGKRYYPDSKKQYYGRAFHLYPEGEPMEMEPANRDPRFMPLDEIFDTQAEGFTPACKLILEVAEYHHRKTPLERGEHILLQEHTVSHILNAGEATE